MPSRRVALGKLAASAFSVPALAATSGAKPAKPKPDYSTSKLPRNAEIGVQIQPHSFFDEGIEHVLDLLQEQAEVNTLYVFTHNWGGTPQANLETLADHGKPLRDPRGRKVRKVWTHTSSDAYSGLSMGAPVEHEGAEYADRWLFDELAEPCRQRGIKIYGRILAPVHATDALIPGISKVMSVDIDGRTGPTPCMNHPVYQQFWRATVADIFINQPLDGFKFGLEFSGPLYRLMGAKQKSACFCEHCEARMKKVGIDPERLRTGYRQLHQWVMAMREDRRSSRDGAFITFLRHLMHHPETLAWERESQLALEETMGLVRDTIHEVKPGTPVGRHVDHHLTSIDPFYRAAITYSEMADKVDFIKPVAYHDIAAPRVSGSFVGGLGGSMFADFKRPEVVDIYYHLFGLDPSLEPGPEEIASGSFSADYVFKETRRCVEGVEGKAKVIPGIGFDVPIYKNREAIPHPSDPADIGPAVHAAFQAGADGILICREYQEMKLANLKAVGDAVRQAS